MLDFFFKEQGFGIWEDDDDEGAENVRNGAVGDFEVVAFVAVVVGWDRVDEDGDVGLLFCIFLFWGKIVSGFKFPECSLYLHDVIF